MQIRWLDRPAPYQTVWQAMQDFTQKRDADTSDEIWLVEHAPVYTLGQAGRKEHVLNPGNIPVVHCDRGGQVTYHGPGQVVLYTLMDLHRRQIFVHDFVELLEQAVLDTIAQAGVKGACRKPGAPGVYVPQSSLTHPQGEALAKIAAVGIKIHGGCAYHGIALNVAMDLAPFSGIDPCGYAGLQTVDMASCGVVADVVDVGNSLAQAFSSVWESDIEFRHRKSA